MWLKVPGERGGGKGWIDAGRRGLGGGKRKGGGGGFFWVGVFFFFLWGGGGGGGGVGGFFLWGGGGGGGGGVGVAVKSRGLKRLGERVGTGRADALETEKKKRGFRRDWTTMIRSSGKRKKKKKKRNLSHNHPVGLGEMMYLTRVPFAPMGGRRGSVPRPLSVNSCMLGERGGGEGGRPFSSRPESSFPKP